MNLSPSLQATAINGGAGGKYGDTRFGFMTKMLKVDNGFTPCEARKAQRWFARKQYHQVHPYIQDRSLRFQLFQAQRNFSERPHDLRYHHVTHQ